MSIIFSLLCCHLVLLESPKEQKEVFVIYSPTFILSCVANMQVQIKQWVLVLKYIFIQMQVFYFGFNVNT